MKELRRANNKDDDEPLAVSDEMLGLIETLKELTDEIRILRSRL